jgi:hypothetical protein
MNDLDLKYVYEYHTPFEHMIHCRENAHHPNGSGGVVQRARVDSRTAGYPKGGRAHPLIVLLSDVHVSASRVAGRWSTTVLPPPVAWREGRERRCKSFDFILWIEENYNHITDNT